MIFKRKIYDKLLQWKKESNGSTAILIEGARRTGKSTIVREFAEKEYKSYIMIDFNETTREIISLFDEGIGGEYDRFFSILQLLEKKTLYPRSSVIVFDEVQAYPKARQLVKYLVKDGRYDYIEIGSFISLKKNVESISIPSEEEKLTLYPMDFEEYLWANGDNVSVPFVKDVFEKRTPVGDAVHRKMMTRYREYMAIGGMPQVVAIFVRNRDFISADKEKMKIWSLYRDDVGKIPEPNGVKASLILSSVSYMLGRNRKIFSPGVVKKNSRVADFIYSLEWLEQSKIINICRDVTDPSPTMMLDVNVTSFKTYVLDTGMLVSLSVADNEMDVSDLYKSLIFDKLSINEGMFFENMVAQEIKASGHDLYFHTFTCDGLSNRYEVDFLLKSGKRIIPIEVKSGNSSMHSSLNHFMDKYSGRCKECFVVHTKDLKVDGNVTYIPIYMAMFL